MRSERVRDRLAGPGRAVFTNVAAATGLLVGVRSIINLELPRPSTLLGLEPMAREGIAIAWSTRAIWPAELQAGAIDRLVGLVAALALAAVAVAALNAWILLAEASAARKAELTVRAALGASPGTIVRNLLGELRTLGMAGFVLGVVLGVSAGAAVRAAWPGVALELETLAAMGSLIPMLASLCLLLVLAHIGTGVRIGTGRAGWDALRSGARTTADPAAVFFRRAIPSVHLAVSGTVLVGTLALSVAVILPARGPGGELGTQVVSVTAPRAGAWPQLLASLDGLPGLAAESLASPGALVGLGVRDHVTSQCGKCYHGDLPTPFWGAVADHHAVTPTFFELAGIELVDGRLLNELDVAGAEHVVVVNRVFALSSFEGGNPLGKKVKLGSTLDAWYTVVGVVADVPTPVPGQDELRREAVYLSAFQQPIRRGHVLLSGTEAAVATAVSRMDQLGFAPTEPRSLSQFRQEAASALRWLRAVGASLAILAALFAAYGVHVTALQVTRRREPELAIRRALGAQNLHVVLNVMGERLRVGLWGAAGMVFWGTMFVAFLRRASGGPAVSVADYLLVIALLLVVSVGASVKAVDAALAVEPGTVID